MKLNRIALLVTIILALLIWGASADADVSQGDRVTRKVKLRDGSSFIVTMVRGKWVGRQYPNAQLWGAWGTSPGRVVSQIGASRASERIFVPFSAYADLAEPNSLEVRPRGVDVEVEVSGGSGGDSYRAILVFAKGEYLSSRTVFASVMPKDAREETHYSVVREAP